MWHFISEKISETLNYDFICDNIRQIDGGDTHCAFKISDGRRRYFVKINTAQSLHQFEREAAGLNYLAKANAIRIPRHICHGTAEANSFLVLEHISFSGGDDTSWYELGQLLAQLHKTEHQKQYGLDDDNYIGSTTQPNKWQQDWNTFFAEQRIGFLLIALAQNGCHFGDIDDTVDMVKSMLAQHKPCASLLHGDLWYGNIGFNKNHPVLFDPAPYFGDRETDLAMTELFSRFPSSFYQGYQNQWPLAQDYKQRRPLYQLYHVLNHALMFGGSYLESAQRNIRQLHS